MYSVIPDENFFQYTTEPLDSEDRLLCCCSITLRRGKIGSPFRWFLATDKTFLCTTFLTF
jgi:hypothetical protein